MKLTILKETKIAGEVHKVGSVVEVDDEAGSILIASAVAESPRKKKPAPKPEPAQEPAQEHATAPAHKAPRKKG